MTPSARPWRRTARYAGLFVAAVLLGRLMRTEPASLSLVWPAVGVATLWLLGSSRRARVLDGALVLGLATAGGALTGALSSTAAVLAAGTLTSALVAAAVLQRTGGGAPGLRTVADGMHLVAATGLAAVSGALVVLLLNPLAVGVDLTAFVGLVAMRNGLGILLVVALGLALRDVREADGWPARWWAAALVEACVTTAVYAAVFVVGDHRHVTFLALPVTLWIGLRSGVARAAVHAVVTGALTVGFTVAGFGNFVDGHAVWRFLLAQAFIGVVTVTVLGLALVHTERRAATRRADATADRLRDTLDSAVIAHLAVRTRAGGGAGDSSSESAGASASAADALGTIERANPAAHALLDPAGAPLLGRRWTDLVDAGHREVVRTALARLGQGEAGAGWTGEVLHVLDDGSRRWTEVSAAAVQAADGEDRGLATVQLLDVTARKAVEDELAHLALHDPLTGLANRVLLQDRLERALAQTARSGGAVALVFFDLDHFKTINDSLGHAAGDEVLLTMARRLEGTARAVDTVARIGGDEFVVCLPGVTDITAARGAAERMLAAVARPTTVAGTPVTVTVSAGVTLSTPTSTAAELLQQSDAAMYEAKGRGRGRVELFDEALTARARRHLELDQALRDALAHEQFVVHYQPVVDLRTGAVQGLEALVRWQHPQRGLLAPGEWLDVAEASDVVVRLGDVVLDVAVATAARLVEDGHDLTMAVNVSARQLRDPGLVDRVRAALERSGLAASRLVLELTETHLLDVHHSVLREVERVRALGVRLAVDDFGTGYSALVQLVRLPVDVVKVDRSWGAAQGDGERGAARGEGVAAMARSLGIDLVAEGVETAEQAAALTAIGCTTAQGYLWSRPVPVEDLVLVRPGDAARALPVQRVPVRAEAVVG